MNNDNNETYDYTQSGNEYSAQPSEQQTIEPAPTQETTTYHYSYPSAPQRPNPYEKNDKQNSTGKLVLGVVIGFIAALLLGGGGIFTYFKLKDGTKAAPDQEPNSPQSSQTVQNDPQSYEEALDEIVDNIQESPVTDTTIPQGSHEKLTYAQIAEKVQPSVCTVLSYYYTTAYGGGSGIILSEDGYILTNAHVIYSADYPNLTITVKVSDKDEEFPAEIIGYDERSDVALLKIETTGLHPAEIGDSDALVVGDEVVAIGTPLDEAYAGTVTNGIVSGLDRVIDSSDTAVKYIQTNAAINPGNSGGPLVNMYGQVVGINTAKIAVTGYEGMGFSIPINDILDIITELKVVGYIARPALGITCVTVSQMDSQYYGVPQGVQIYSIAKASGLAGKVEIGDIITKINDTDVTDTGSLTAALDSCEIGDKVDVTLYRPKTKTSEAKTYTVSIVLGSDAEIDYNDVITNNHNHGGR